MGKTFRFISTLKYMPSPGLVQYLGTQSIPKSRRIRGQRRRMMPRYRRLTRKPRYNLYSYKRTFFYDSSIAVGSAVNFSTHYGFTLADLPDVSNFTGLYDEYRINKVVFKLVPKFTETEQGTGIANYLNQIHTAIDYDDSNALLNATAINDICQYQSHRMHIGNRMVTRVITPKIELEGLGGGQAPKARQWLDCDNTGVLHNGLKVVIPKMNNASSLVLYDVCATVYVSFRNVV